MACCLVFFILIIPSFIARILLQKQGFHLNSVLSDISVSASFLCLLYYFPNLAVFLIGIIQFCILLDAWLQKNTGLRLNPVYFLLIFHLNEFRGSAKVLKFHQTSFFLGIIVFLITIVKQIPYNFSLWAFVGLSLNVFYSFYPYSSTNWLQYAIRSLWKKKKAEKVDASFLIPRNEVYQYYSPKYPLLRFTNAYKGKKSFNSSITKDSLPHIFFLFVESLRHQNLKTKEPLTPNLDRLAKNGVLFTNFYSNSLDTFRSIFSALYGIPYDLNIKPQIQSNLPLIGLIDQLKKLGYQTNFINAATWSLNGMRSFLAQHGANNIIDKKDIRKVYPHLKESSWGIFDQYLFDYSLQHLKNNSDKPQFYSLSTITMHHPYTLPNDYNKPFAPAPKGSDYEKYLQALAYTDECIGNFMNQLKNHDLTQNALFFIMGDHGVNFNNQGSVVLYAKQEKEESFKVPLIIYGENQIEKGIQIDAPSSHLDLLPTIMDLLQIQGFHLSIGKSLYHFNDNHPVFFYNPSNPENDIFVKHRNQLEASAEQKTERIEQFKKIFQSLYINQNFIPIQQEKDTILTEKEIQGLREEDLVQKIKDNGPFSHLYLKRHPEVTDEVLKAIANNSPNLSLLDIDGCLKVTDRGLEAIIRKCPYLMFLNISRCLKLTKKSVLSAFKHLSDLDTILLENLSFVNHQLLKDMNPHPALMFCSIYKTSISNLSLMPTIFPNLYSARIVYPSGDPRSLVSFLINSFTYQIEIEDCQELSDELFREIIQYPYNTLKHITLKGTLGLTHQAFSNIKNIKLQSLTLLNPIKMSSKGVKDFFKLPIAQLFMEGVSSYPIFNGPNRFPSQ